MKHKIKVYSKLNKAPVRGEDRAARKTAGVPCDLVATLSSLPGRGFFVGV